MASIDYGTYALDPGWSVFNRAPMYREPAISIDSNCRNCAAPIAGDECDYCGTVYRYREPAPAYSFMACSTGMDFMHADPRGRRRR